MSESLEVQVYKYMAWLGRIVAVRDADTRLQQLDLFLNTISNNSAFLQDRGIYGRKLNELYGNAQKEFISILKGDE